MFGVSHAKVSRPPVLPNPVEFAFDAKLARAAAQPPKLPQYRGLSNSIHLVCSMINH
jgi:hypothetical protein